jgi:hypothetical protein
LNTQPDSRPFKDILLATLPGKYVTPEGKQQFSDIAQRLDTLGKVHQQTKQIFIDEQQFRSLIRTHLPAGVEEQCMRTLKAASGNTFVNMASLDQQTQQNLSPLSWQQLAKETRQLMTQPPIDDSQLGSSPTAEKIIQTIKQYAPKAPDSLFEPKAFRDHLLPAAGASATIAENELINEDIVSNIWNCMVSNLGFWGALAATVLVIVVASAIGTALVASGGTLGVLFWAAFWPALAVAGAAGASFYVICVIVMCMGY